MPTTADTGYQRRVYENGFYRRFRRLRWALRYDCRYRLLLMEELFARWKVPFEHLKVFELGFGTGDLLLRFDTSCTLHGCEASREAVALLRAEPVLRQYRQVQLTVAGTDGRARFPGSDYDLIIASHVLEHVPDDRRALADLAGHARKGGWGLFFVPLERPRRRHRHHVRTYSAAGFHRLCNDCGWQVLESEENMRLDSPQENLLIALERRTPTLAAVFEGSKNLLFSLVPTGLFRLSDERCRRLYWPARQLAVLARTY